MASLAGCVIRKSLILTLPASLSLSQQAAKIPGVGVKLAEKIESLALTGSCSRMDLLTQPRVLAQLALGKIWGVGPVTARKLCDKGYRDIPQLREAVSAGKERLTAQQLVGLEL